MPICWVVDEIIDVLVDYMHREAERVSLRGAAAVSDSETVKSIVTDLACLPYSAVHSRKPPTWPIMLDMFPPFPVQTEAGCMFLEERELLTGRHALAEQQCALAFIADVTLEKLIMHVAQVLEDAGPAGAWAEDYVGMLDAFLDGRPGMVPVFRSPLCMEVLSNCRRTVLSLLQSFLRSQRPKRIRTAARLWRTAFASNCSPRQLIVSGNGLVKWLVQNATSSSPVLEASLQSMAEVFSVEPNCLLRTFMKTPTDVVAAFEAALVEWSFLPHHVRSAVVTMVNFVLDSQQVLPVTVTCDCRASFSGIHPVLVQSLLRKLLLSLLRVLPTFIRDRFKTVCEDSAASSSAAVTEWREGIELMCSASLSLALRTPHDFLRVALQADTARTSVYATQSRRLSQTQVDVSGNWLLSEVEEADQLAAVIEPTSGLSAPQIRSRLKMVLFSYLELATRSGDAGSPSIRHVFCVALTRLTARTRPLLICLASNGCARCRPDFSLLDLLGVHLAVAVRAALHGTSLQLPQAETAPSSSVLPCLMGALSACLGSSDVPFCPPWVDPGVVSETSLSVVCWNLGLEVLSSPPVDIERKSIFAEDTKPQWFMTLEHATVHMLLFSTRPRAERLTPSIWDEHGLVAPPDPPVSPLTSFDAPVKSRLNWLLGRKDDILLLDLVFTPRQRPPQESTTFGAAVTAPAAGPAVDQGAAMASLNKATQPVLVAFESGDLYSFSVSNPWVNGHVTDVIENFCATVDALAPSLHALPACIVELQSATLKVLFSGLDELMSLESDLMVEAVDPSKGSALVNRVACSKVRAGQAMERVARIVPCLMNHEVGLSQFKEDVSSVCLLLGWTGATIRRCPLLLQLWSAEDDLAGSPVSTPGADEDNWTGINNKGRILHVFLNRVFQATPNPSLLLALSWLYGASDAQGLLVRLGLRGTPPEATALELLRPPSFDDTQCTTPRRLRPQAVEADVVLQGLETCVPLRVLLSERLSDLVSVLHEAEGTWYLLEKLVRLDCSSLNPAAVLTEKSPRVRVVGGHFLNGVLEHDGAFSRRLTSPELLTPLLQALAPRARSVSLPVLGCAVWLCLVGCVEASGLVGAFEERAEEEFLGYLSQWTADLTQATQTELGRVMLPMVAVLNSTAGARTRQCLVSDVVVPLLSLDFVDTSLLDVKKWADFVNLHRLQAVGIVVRVVNSLTRVRPLSAGATYREVFRVSRPPANAPERILMGDTLMALASVVHGLPPRPFLSCVDTDTLWMDSRLLRKLETQLPPGVAPWARELTDVTCLWESLPKHPDWPLAAAQEAIRSGRLQDATVPVGYLPFIVALLGKEESAATAEVNSVNVVATESALLMAVALWGDEFDVQVDLVVGSLRKALDNHGCVDSSTVLLLAAMALIPDVGLPESLARAMIAHCDIRPTFFDLLSATFTHCTPGWLLSQRRKCAASLFAELPSTGSVCLVGHLVRSIRNTDYDLLRSLVKSLRCRDHPNYAVLLGVLRDCSWKDLPGTDCYSGQWSFTMAVSALPHWALTEIQSVGLQENDPPRKRAKTATQTVEVPCASLPPLAAPDPQAPLTCFVEDVWAQRSPTHVAEKLLSLLLVATRGSTPVVDSSRCPSLSSIMLVVHLLCGGRPGVLLTKSGVLKLDVTPGSARAPESLDSRLLAMFDADRILKGVADSSEPASCAVYRYLAGGMLALLARHCPAFRAHLSTKSLQCWCQLYAWHSVAHAPDPLPLLVVLLLDWSTRGPACVSVCASVINGQLQSPPSAVSDAVSTVLVIFLEVYRGLLTRVADYVLPSRDETPVAGEFSQMFRNINLESVGERALQLDMPELGLVFCEMHLQNHHFELTPSAALCEEIQSYPQGFHPPPALLKTLNNNICAVYPEQAEPMTRSHYLAFEVADVDTLVAGITADLDADAWEAQLAGYHDLASQKESIRLKARCQRWAEDWLGQLEAGVVGDPKYATYWCQFLCDDGEARAALEFAYRTLKALPVEHSWRHEVQLAVIRAQWGTGDEQLRRVCLRLAPGVLCDLQRSKSPARVEALVDVAQWSVQLGVKSVQEVKKEFIDEALQHKAGRSRALLEYGQLLDSMLEQADAARYSATRAEAQQIIEERTTTLQGMQTRRAWLMKQSSKSQRKEVEAVLRRLDHQIHSLESNIGDMEESVADWLVRETLETYWSYLATVDCDVRVAARVATLLFSVESDEVAECVVGLLEAPCLAQLRHLAPLTPQIASRLQEPVSEMAKAIFSLLVKLLVHFPFAAFYPIWAFSRTSREAIARRVVEEAMSQSQSVNYSKTIEAMKVTSDFYVKLADLEVPESASKGKMTRNAELNRVYKQHCASLGVQPMITLINEDAVTGLSVAGFEAFALNHPECIVDRVESTFSMTASGIHRPKILVVFDRTGHAHRHLVKAKDDCRSDSTMQQVFRLMNQTFRRERGLKGVQLRTYGVIPLSPQHGVIQWVAGTATLGEVLLGSAKLPGLHQKYFPGDLTNEECKKLLHTERESYLRRSRNRSSLAHSLHEVFRSNILPRFRPALHFFFYERFQSARDILEAKRRYAVSLAAWSMVGPLSVTHADMPPPWNR